MKQFIGIMGIILLLSGCSIMNEDETPSAKKLVIPESEAISKIGQDETKNIEFSDEKDGVTVTINDIRKNNGSTTMNLVMDNHRYDISQMDIANLSALNGARTTSYQIEKSLMGGHHVNAKITFPGEPTGELIIGLNADLQFKFETQ